jgi:hypothetical protein
MESSGIARGPPDEFQEQSISWLGLEAGEYQPPKQSRLIGLSAHEWAELIDWP